LLAAGMVEDVKQIILTFARFEEKGTLPNTIHGEDARNRDTSDAPLWFGIVCEELANVGQASGLSSEAPNPGLSSASPATGGRPGPLYSTIVDRRGRTIAGVLSSIAGHYRGGTPNGIRMDEESALIWSPSHFTWMDTNFPAATPREGYPIEIQVLWIRLLRQLKRIGAEGDGQTWAALADRAEASLKKYFWLEDSGYFADLLIAGRGKPAAAAIVDRALRSNYLLAVSLGLVAGERAQRCVDAALRYLIVPGALRSLAPVPVSPPLPIYGSDGHLLNNPTEPYQGRYEGDEDTRRKVAYHNGTAWTWTFPVFCEALASAWDFSPHAIAAAKAYLGSMEQLMNEGCLGQIPEILDGDAPHQSRGCDAQAWGVTEALRVWRLLDRRS
jgi:starch synthase (maltosyl-transferring)